MFFWNGTYFAMNGWFCRAAGATFLPYNLCFKKYCFREYEPAGSGIFNVCNKKTA